MKDGAVVLRNVASARGTLELPPGVTIRSCTFSLRVNTRGLPGDRHQNKMAWTRGPAWPPGRPRPPGDTLDAGRVDARHHLRPPHRPASHHPACLHPDWLRPRRHAE